MIKNIFKIFLIFILGMVGGIFGSEIIWPYFVERPLFYQYRLEQNPIYVTERKEIKIQENVALKEAIEQVEKSVVLVRVKNKTGKIVEGSGVILTSDGLMVTLANLLSSASNFTFFVDDEITNFQVLKIDIKENLALIKLEKKNLKTVGFFDLDKLKLGERIFLVGKVFEEGKIKAVTNEGIVKNFNENKIETNINENKNLDGSPIFDIVGNLIGLCQIDKEGRIIVIPNSKIKIFSGL